MRWLSALDHIRWVGWVDMIYYLYLAHHFTPGAPLDPGGTGPLRWILDDEAQDNTLLRILLLKRLRDEAEGGAERCRLFAVGDDMQATNK